MILPFMEASQATAAMRGVAHGNEIELLRQVLSHGAPHGTEPDKSGFA